MVSNKPIKRTLYLHFKPRYACYSPLVSDPKANNVDFVTPSRMRMLFVASGGDCSYSYGGYSGVSFTVKDGHGYVINNVPRGITLNAPTHGAIYIDRGEHSSNWVLIAGNKNMDEYSIVINNNSDLLFNSSENATSTLDLEGQDVVETSTTDTTVFSIKDRNLTQDQ